MFLHQVSSSVKVTMTQFFYLSCCFQLNLRGPPLLSLLLEGQKSSQRSACWDIWAIFLTFITWWHFITVTAAAWMTTNHTKSKGMYVLNNPLVETIHIINVVSAFCIIWQPLCWTINKSYEHSLDSLSWTQAFFPILEAWPSLLLLPVPMETGPGSWAQQHTLGSDTGKIFTHRIHRNTHKGQNNDTTHSYIFYDGAFCAVRW